MLSIDANLLLYEVRKREMVSPFSTVSGSPEGSVMAHNPMKFLDNT